MKHKTPLRPPEHGIDAPTHLAMSSRLSPSPDLTSPVDTIVCDEASPLLAEGRALEAQHKSAAVVATPVPKAALFALCAVRIVDP
jgi:hypothetical protein